MRPDKDPRYERIFIANQFDLKVVNGKIPIPDLRIEYEDDCREIRRLDLEVATATTGPKGLARRPRPDFISSLGNRTTPSCAAFSIPMKSPRGSSPCENPAHLHGSPPRFRLHGGGSSLSLPCGYAFRVLHLPAVFAVRRDKTRQAQRRLCPKSGREEARQLQGIPPAWPNFHLFSRNLYEAIGRENVRFRRVHSTEYIRTRLIALDFILRNQDFTYLESEGQKLSFFCDQLGIDKKILPHKRYSGAIRDNFTDRYFVDKFPMYYNPAVSLPLW